MKIGYLHLGSPEHGITRYGRILAAEARNHPHLKVVEAHVSLTGDTKEDLASIVEAAKTLSHSDVVHVQYNRSLWGVGWYQLRTLRGFIQHCSSPLVVTLHDVYYPPSSLAMLQGFWDGMHQTDFAGLLRAIGRDAFGPNILALRKLIKHAKLAFVCTEEETRRLSARIPLEKVRTIPHFVESRCIETTPLQARQSLNLEGYRVITLLGFIFPNKGHKLLIKSLALLPDNCFAVFAGGASKGGEAYFQALSDLAQKEGVSNRLRITGYLSEEDQEQYLIATDLAVCPFLRASASGSLSTWVSAERPILASDLPLVAEYNQLQSGAIRVFSPYTAHALAESIKVALEEIVSPAAVRQAHALSCLRRQLSVGAVFQEHLVIYADIAAA